MKAHVLALVAALLASPALAQAPDGERDRDRGERGHWLQDLGLSPEQMTKIKEVKQKKREATEKLLDEQDRLHEELKRLMASDEPADKAREVHKKLQDVQREMRDAHFESMLAIRELLKPEQRQRFVEKMKLRGPHAEGFGRRHKRDEK